MIDVSVIITCHNKEKYLGDAIESIHQQTAQPKEIIVVHDGCENPQSFVRTTTIINRETHGVCEARALGVKLTTGKFLLFLDADDMLQPDYLERMIKIKADIVYTDALVWYNHEDFQPGTTNEIMATPKRIIPKLMMKQCQITVSSLMKREVFEILGGFKNLPIFEDYDFWLRAMAQGFSFKQAHTLLWYRQLKNSRNRASKEVKRRVYAQIKSQFEIKEGKLCLVPNIKV